MSSPSCWSSDSVRYLPNFPRRPGTAGGEKLQPTYSFTSCPHLQHCWFAVTEIHQSVLSKGQLQCQVRQVLLSSQGGAPGILRAGCPVWKEPAGKTLPGNLVTPQVENMDLTPWGTWLSLANAMTCNVTLGKGHNSFGFAFSIRRICRED